MSSDRPDIDCTSYRAWLIARGVIKPKAERATTLDAPTLRLDAIGQRAAAHAIAQGGSAPPAEIANRAFLAHQDEREMA